MRLRVGFTIVESLVSMAVLGILVSTVFPTIGWLLTRARVLQHEGQAALILQESIEVPYNVFLEQWSIAYSVFPDGDYYPAVDVSGTSNKWTLLAGEQANVQTRFFRKITLTSVCRNRETGEIVNGACGGDSEIDPNSKQVSAVVSWTERSGQKDISASLLITRLSY